MLEVRTTCRPRTTWTLWTSRTPETPRRSTRHRRVPPDVGGLLDAVDSVDYAGVGAGSHGAALGAADGGGAAGGAAVDAFGTHDVGPDALVAAPGLGAGVGGAVVGRHGLGDFGAGAVVAEAGLGPDNDRGDGLVCLLAGAGGEAAQSAAECGVRARCATVYAAPCSSTWNDCRASLTGVMYKPDSADAADATSISLNVSWRSPPARAFRAPFQRIALARPSCCGPAPPEVRTRCSRPRVLGSSLPERCPKPPVPGPARSSVSTCHASNRGAPDSAMSRCR